MGRYKAYVLWGTVQDGERFLYRTEVRAQKEPIRPQIQTGEGVEVEVQVPDGVSLRGVSAYGLGVRRRVRMLDPTATEFRIPGLPPGRWTVQVLGSSATRPGARPESWSAEAEARPGDSVKLTLQPVDRR